MILNQVKLCPWRVSVRSPVPTNSKIQHNLRHFCTGETLSMIANASKITVASLHPTRSIILYFDP